ncbi:MAG: hypothetical protein ABI678_18005, partial [Kofleriaceae bacterium]
MKRALVLALLFACGNGNKAHQDGSMQPQDSGIDPFQDAPIDAPVLPVFRNSKSAMSDDQVALQALQLIGDQSVPGAQTQSCNVCHAITKAKLKSWRAMSDTGMHDCLTDLEVMTTDSAKAMLSCMRVQPSVETSMFAPSKLGIYATAGRLPWFDYTIWKAYGDQAPAQKASFITTAAMPHDTNEHLFTQDEFDVVSEWFIRGLPQLDSYFPDGPPTTCTADMTAAVAQHTTDLSTTGWRAINRDNALAMFDCGTATDPRMCLQNQALASTKAYGTGWDIAGHGTNRVLDEITFASSYWTRSSADGRFVGYGANLGHSVVTDLARSGGPFHISVFNASYDPGFFPDNAAWVFQNSGKVCPQSTLTSNPSSVQMNEPGCAALNSIGLYQHVGKALNGGDYFTISGLFTSDNGGHGLTTHQPEAPFGSTSSAKFTPFINTGTTFQSRPPVYVTQAYEGDDVLSPSATLEITRLGNATNGNQLGYVLHKVNIAGTAPNYTVTTPEIARYCITGGKPAFSYDERWIVYHHYIENTTADAIALGFTGTTDAGVQPYIAQGGANIYLMDLATATPIRITNMKPGQYALMPHFRS